ncbi:MAG: hypothetical protein ABR536_05225 [Solirubrobacterales bacterium]
MVGLYCAVARRARTILAVPISWKISMSILIAALLASIVIAIVKLA